MRRSSQISILILSLGGWCLAESASGQVVLDGTTNSTLEVKPKVSVIKNGTQLGEMLFHSFKEFSIAEGQTVRFQPPKPGQIQTVFARVTGNQMSHLRGKLRTVPKLKADVIFLNPNGIVFHENFVLDIKGSFLATTAESVLFAGGDRFSADASESFSLLKLSVPIGLQFGAKPGPIQVLTGNEKTGFNAKNGVKVDDFQDIALMGGDIIFETGKLIASGGNVWLGSASQAGTIDWTFEEAWNFSYAGLPERGQISLRENSRIFSSFNPQKGAKSTRTSGHISIAAANINLDNSELNAENLGQEEGGGITLDATQQIRLRTSHPFDSTTQQKALLSTQPLGQGGGGDIYLAAKRLRLVGRETRIVTDSAGQRPQLEPLGGPGDITLDVRDKIELRDGSAISAVTSSVDTPSGNVEVKTKRLELWGGSQIRSSTEGIQAGGKINVDVSDSILLSGVLDFTRNEERIFRPSGLSSDANRDNVGGVINITTPYLRIENGAAILSNVPGVGRSGDIRIKVERLELIDGGQLLANANNLEAGTAGNIDVQASSYIVIHGKIQLPNRQSPLEERAAGFQAETNTQLENSVGTGDIRIKTPLLILQNGGVISTNASGTQGGNIILDISSLLFLNQSSRIVSNARTGPGGSVRVSGSPWIIAPPGSNSDITANSELADGGRIFFDNRGISGFNITEVPLSPEQLEVLNFNQVNDIAASSGRPNRQGEVVINNLDTLTKRFITLIPSMVQPEKLEQCNALTAEKASVFQMVGRGGFSSPALQSSALVWDDTRLQPDVMGGRDMRKDRQRDSRQIIQATGWMQTRGGDIALTSQTSSRASLEDAIAVCYALFSS